MGGTGSLISSPSTSPGLFEQKEGDLPKAMATNGMRKVISLSEVKYLLDLNFIVH